MNANGQKVRSELADFIASKSKYIFHYLGPKDTGKSAQIYQILEDLKQDRSLSTHFQIIDPTLLGGHQNMVIETFHRILKDILEIFCLKTLGEATEEEREKIVDFYKFKKHFNMGSIYDYFDNVGNAQVIVDTFRLKALGNLGITWPKENAFFLLVLDNAENIFGRHLHISENKREKELFIQWKTLLMEIVELNSKRFRIKILLISNEQLHALPDMGKYTTRNSNSLARRLSGGDYNKKIAYAIQALDKNPCDEKAFSCQLDELKKDKILENSRKNHEFVDIAYSLMNYGNHGELLRLMDHVAHSPPKGQWILERLNELSHAVCGRPAFGNKTKEIYFEFIKSYGETIIRELADPAKANELLAIHLEFSLYRWIVLIVPRLKRILSKNGHMKGESAPEEKIRAIYAPLARLLCFPLQNRLFNDVGILLNNYGYDHHLKEALEEIQGNEGAGAPDLDKRIHVRLKVLKGNQFYYNYPEDYVKALGCYVEGLEIFHRIGFRCDKNGKSSQGCVQLQALLYFDIASSIHQILSREAFKNYAPVKTRELRSGLEHLEKFLPGLLLRHYYHRRFSRRKSDADWDLKNQMLILQRYLLKRLTALEENDGDSKGKIDHVACWQKIEQNKRTETKNEADANPTIQYRKIVTRLKYLQDSRLSGWPLLHMIRKIVTHGRGEQIKPLGPIHFYSPALAGMRAKFLFYAPALSGKMFEFLHKRTTSPTKRSRRLFHAGRRALGRKYLRTRALFARATLLNATLEIESNLFGRAEVFWHFLAVWHFWELLSKELKRFLIRYEKAREKEGSYDPSYVKLNEDILSVFTKIVDRILDRLNTLKKNMTAKEKESKESEEGDKLKENYTAKDEHASMSGIEHLKTWRIARTYELLGDVKALLIECARINSEPPNRALLESIVEFYTQASDRYFRIGSHYLFEKIKEKMSRLAEPSGRDNNRQVVFIK